MYEEYLSHFKGEITKEINTFVEDTVFLNERYIFTEKINGEQQGYCTHCHKEFKTSKLKHKSNTICPMCGSKCKVQSSAYKRTNFIHRASFVFFEKSIKDPNTIVATEYFVTKDFTGDYKNVENGYTILGLTIFEPGKSTMLKQNIWSNEWTLRSTVFKVGNGEWYRRYEGYTSYESIKKAIKGTYFQYSTWNRYKDEDMLKFFALYSKYPCIEYLTKMGLSHLVRYKLQDRPMYRTINWRGKTVFDVLKLTKSELKEIRQNNIEVSLELLYTKKLMKDICKLSLIELKDYSELAPYDIGEDIKKISKKVNLSKLHKYLIKQRSKDKEHICGFYGAFATYRDYLKDCKILKMNLKDERVLFPKSLYEMHQNTIKQIKTKEDKALNIKIKDRLESLNQYKFEFNGLFIRPAKSSIELIEEGSALNHCVARYAEKYSKGITNIFVIRRLDTPNKPYFTVEIRNNKIVQVRGNRNCDPGKDIKEFIEMFKEKKLNIKPKKKGKVA